VAVGRPQAPNRARLHDAAYIDHMLPLIVVVVLFAVLRSAGALGVRALKDWRVCLRFALAAMFLITSTAHWGAKRADLIAMVPPFFPRPDLLVTLTGICEIAGAIGLMIPRTARLAAALLAVMLIALFPANYYAAEQGLQIGGEPVTELPQRTAVQIALVAACVAVAVKPGTRREASIIAA
jgi:uncharacterized membrane protein